MQKSTVQYLIGFGCLSLILSVIGEFFVHLHPAFSLDALPFFHAWYGFIACVAIVLFSKLCGVVLKRREAYYTNEQDE